MTISIKEVAKGVGGVVAMGKAMGLSRGTVTQWGGVVPLKHVLEVERLTGIPRHELRPDYFLLPAPR